jgi:aminobenzoyl-glutamate utilization protein B
MRQTSFSATLYIGAWILAPAVVGLPAESSAQNTAADWLAANESYLVGVADALWAIPEPAHAEVQSSEYLQGELSKAGFLVTQGVADLPTAFVASYGSGRPVIGIVALLDALPGLSQERFATERRPIVPGGPGHGCGHNLIGAADLGAALALRHAIDVEELEATIRFYGAPAEEIYHGGVYMVRAGVFDDVDALLFWHPSAVTTVISRSGLAMDSVRFVFHGRASDATDAADKGVNALSAAYQLAGALDSESWPADAVVNHVLLEGGTIPSIVPERATQWLFIHGGDRESVAALRTRIDALAESIARASGTRLEIQLLSSASEWLINRELGNLLHRSLVESEPISYTRDEVAFANQLRREFDATGAEALLTSVYPPAYTDEPVPISDDTAEASWVTPRGGFLVACFPADVPSHSWQWASSASSSFAHKGMLRAARALTATAIELMTNEQRMVDVRREFEEATRGLKYESPLPREREAFDYLRK